MRSKDAVGWTATNPTGARRGGMVDREDVDWRKRQDASPDPSKISKCSAVSGWDRAPKGGEIVRSGG